MRGLRERGLGPRSRLLPRASVSNDRSGALYSETGALSLSSGTPSGRGGSRPHPAATLGGVGFVDCHSHVVPSGDDGAVSVGEGAALCQRAAALGTRVLFATPHVWPHLPLTDEREARIRTAFARLAPVAGLELRLGYELTPTEDLLAEDPRRYALEGTDSILMEVPFAGPLEPLVALAEHAEAAGLTPVIAHPERTEAIQKDVAAAADLAERGWLLQVNSSSLLGRHGDLEEELAWKLVEDGDAALVASDGHRAARPPQLDEAYERARRRLGEEAARPLFDGTALGLNVAERSDGTGQAPRKVHSTFRGG